VHVALFLFGSVNRQAMIISLLVSRDPDMRKALSRDVEKKSIIPLEKPIHPDELEW
jgi:hypothetical protein